MTTRSELIKKRDRKESQMDKLKMDLAKAQTNADRDKVANAIRELEKQIHEIDEQLLTAKD